MKFFSTAGHVKEVSLKQAIYEGFAKDGGLYLPELFPTFSLQEMQKWKGLSFLEISIELAKRIFKEDLSPQVIEKLCEETFDFPLPVLSFSDKIFFAELFHGDTLSFKDFGARFLAKLMHFWNEPTLVLVATSGDTGSAVGRAFYGLPATKVFILYPKNRVSAKQEMQITTIGRNVTALEVEGSFEDCQQLLKKAVLDPDLAPITTANSINVGRILAQALYFFYSFLQLPDTEHKVVLSVPSGNFGHLVSGIFAERMGLPVERFLAATNLNDVVPLYLKSGVFKPHPAYKTIAVSMDVGDPSNFPRLLTLYNASIDEMRQRIVGTSYTDEEILAIIHQVYDAQGYVLDPHSATAYLALKEYFSIEKTPHLGIFFATAHPAKFDDQLSFAHILTPEKLKGVSPKQQCRIPINTDYFSFKELLLKAQSQFS